MASKVTMLVVEKYSNMDGDPSLAPAGNALEAILKLSGVQYEAKETGNPSRSPNGELPFAYFEDKVLPNFVDVLDVIHQQTSHMDSHLSAVEMGRLKIFINSLFLQLHPIYLHLIWVDEETYSSFTYGYVKSLHPFPLNMVIPRLERSRIKTNLESIGLADAEILKERAGRYLAELSQSLGESDFFFGERLSSFEVLFYGYILSLRSPKVKTNVVLEQLESFPNLCKLIDRCGEAFGIAPVPFPVRFQPPPSNSPPDAATSSDESAEDEKSKNKNKYNKIFVGLVVLALLVHNSTRLIDSGLDDDFIGFGDEDDDEDDDE